MVVYSGVFLGVQLGAGSKKSASAAAVSPVLAGIQQRGGSTDGPRPLCVPKASLDRALSMPGRHGTRGTAAPAGRWHRVT